MRSLFGRVGVVATAIGAFSLVAWTATAPAQGAVAPVATRVVHPRFDLASPETSPFPSDRFTVADGAQITGRRINLPLPADCDANASDCQDVAVLNQLDGFNLTPRLSLPFDGDIDPATATSAHIFLISLGSSVLEDDGGVDDAIRRGSSVGRITGIDQVVWDAATRTLHAGTDAPLEEHARYAVVVTRGVRGADGRRIEPSAAFRRFRALPPGARDRETRWYRRALLTAEGVASRSGVDRRDVAALSVFSTRSVTYLGTRIRDQVFAAAPPVADFHLAPDGGRAVYPFGTITDVTFDRQTAAAGPLSPLPGQLLPLRFVPGAVATVGFGRFRAADYLVHPGEYLPAIATGTGAPAVQGTNTLYFNVYLPSGPKPANGWPVAIAGHGRGLHKNFTVNSGTSVVVARGVAVVAINAVGHGFGPDGTLTLQRADGTSVVLPAGGRGVDQDGDGLIGAFEGFEALAPRALLAHTDAMVQTVADLMQVIRMLQGGVDVDGDGAPDLDASQITFFGHSLGGLYGLPLHALTPALRASVFSAIGSPILENRRLSPTSRPLVAERLGARTPSLLNSASGQTTIAGVPVADGPTFDEHLPLRGAAPVVNTVPGAIAIQRWLDRSIWIGQVGDAAAYAPRLRRDPLPGVPARPFLIQVAEADQMTALPTAYNIIHGAQLEDRTALYRHDLFWPTAPTAPKNAHGFPIMLPQAPYRPIVVGAQEQIAGFLASGGATTPSPAPAEYWEFPLTRRLPDTLNYIP